MECVWPASCTRSHSLMAIATLHTQTHTAQLEKVLNLLLLFSSSFAGALSSLGKQRGERESLPLSSSSLQSKSKRNSRATFTFSSPPSLELRLSLSLCLLKALILRWKREEQREQRELLQFKVPFLATSP